MASPVPGYRVVFPTTAASVAEEAEKLVSKSAKFHDSLASQPVAEVTVANFAQRRSDFEAAYSITRSAIELIQHLFPDKEMRDASSEAERKICDHEVEVEMRKDLFDRFKAVQQRLHSGAESATPEMVRYVDHSVLDGVRNGLHLQEDERRRVKEIKTEMNLLAIDFQKNLSEDVTFVTFSREELAGLPDDFFGSLEKDEASGKLKVTVKYPHYFPTMKLATNPETRRRLGLAFSSRCKETNIPLLQQLIELRREKAGLLKYPTHADFILERLMAKSAATVDNFLSSLSQKLKPLQAKERQKLLETKQRDCEQHGIEFDGQLNAWDLGYLMNKVVETEYSVDHEKLKEYFPIERVTKGLLEIYQQILGVKFTPIPDCWVWHKDVSAFGVDDSQSGSRLGYFLIDLYPRDGKYGHAKIFALQPSCLIAGERQLAVCALVTNFTKPMPEKPSLLTHDDVKTFFHEFGHVMHEICSQPLCAKFRGTNVERDFVEAPSQMLENWVWSKKSLELMSGHYVTGDPIPSDLLQSLINSRSANKAFFNQRQISLGTFDQAIHTSDNPNLDVVAEYARISEQITGVAPSEGSAFPASFGHLASASFGYDAQYYGYMWSEVYSADMFCSRFGDDRVLDPESGRAYRECVLQPGGSCDAGDMLRDFLGREPAPDAFLKQIGL